MVGTLISPRLRFAYRPNAFSLSYRASDEPQLLTIDLLAGGKVFPFPSTISLRTWITHALSTPSATVDVVRSMVRFP